MSAQNHLRACRALFFTLPGLVFCPAHAQLLISEIYYDAVGTDRGQVFVELIGTPGTLLNGLSLLGINGSRGGTYMKANLSGSIPADQLFVIGDDDGDGTTLVANVDLIAKVDFQNGPDSIVLWDGDAALDAVGYGDFSSAVFAGEGSPAINAPPGFSLARRFPYGDTDNNAVDFVVAEPTPGTVASAEVPLSGTFGFTVAGLLLAGARLLVHG